jgi:hypothetical protein
MGSTEILWYCLPTAFFHEQLQTCSFIYASLKFHLVLHYIHSLFHNIFFTTGINTDLQTEIAVTSNFLVANK